eukprot:1510306-Alexandrium_andersonii.AAC.3
MHASPSNAPVSLPIPGQSLASSCKSTARPFRTALMPSTLAMGGQKQGGPFTPFVAAAPFSTFHGSALPVPS